MNLYARLLIITADNNEIVMCFELARIGEERGGRRRDAQKGCSEEIYKTRDIHGSHGGAAALCLCEGVPPIYQLR